MNQNSGNPEHNSLLARLQTVKTLSQKLLELTRCLPENEENSELLNTALLISEIGFDDLIESSVSPVETGPTNSEIEEFRHEIEHRDQKIQELKLNLADAVVDQKNSQKALQSANERNTAMATQVAQMQLHSKDLSLRLSSSTAALNIRESELETARNELEILRSSQYQLKTQSAVYEDQLKKSADDIARILEDQKLSLTALDKANRDLEHVATSNREMKKSIEHLEMQEKELIETVDSLQKERNHLQLRLTALLTGVNRTVEYNQTSASPGNPAVLEPSSLPVYLPFCFPERLPVAIRFRREIGQTFPAASSKRISRAPSVFMSPEKSARPSTEAVRSQTRTPRVKRGAIQELPLAYHRFSLVTPDMNQQRISATGLSDIAPRNFEFSQTDDFSAIRQIWWQKMVRLAGPGIHFESVPKFEISTRSFELFLQFLISTFVRRVYQSEPSHKIQLRMPEKAGDINDRLNFSINFAETLAFRHRLQLKSTKLDMPRINVVHSFKLGNRLKSVLETFGNTISSIVHRFESIPDSQSGNGEDK